jgi:glycosyltransferase involved in cell wall biosynthesis
MISIAITTYNRYEMTIQCFEQVKNDVRVDEVIISDDKSDDGSYEKLKQYFKFDSKVHVFQNDENIDCFYNKKRVLELASNDWCCLWDSDNVFSIDYLDRIFDCAWHEKTMLAPVFAYPNFNYCEFEGLIIDAHNVADYMDKPMFSTALNTHNMFVNRNEFLKVWDGSINPVTSDSILFNYFWLNAGNKIHFVKDLCYYHRVHPNSHYQTNVHKTQVGLHDQIENNLKLMR